MYHVLREVTDAYIFGKDDAPAGRILFARKKPEQGGLSCAVFSHEGYLVFGVYEETDVVKERRSSKFYAELFYGNHASWEAQAFIFSISSFSYCEFLLMNLGTIFFICETTRKSLPSQL